MSRFFLSSWFTSPNVLALALGPSIARVLNMKKYCVCFVVFQLLTSSMSRALGSFVCLGNTVAVVVEDGMGLFLDRNSGSYSHLKNPIPRNYTRFEMSAMVTVTVDCFQPGLDQNEVSLKISKTAWDCSLIGILARTPTSKNQFRGITRPSK